MYQVVGEEALRKAAGQAALSAQEENFIEEWGRFLQIGDPFDLASFGWGILAGGIITLVVEGVVLYFTWPILIGFLKGLVGGEAIREVLG